MPSLNKSGLEFKSSISLCKWFNSNKMNQPIYKCSYCYKLGYLDTFCFDKLRKSKGRNPRPLETTNAPGPKKFW